MRWNKNELRRSLTLRLIAAYVGALLSTAAIIIGTVAGNLAWNGQSLTLRSIENEVDTIISRIRFDSEGRPSEVALSDASRFLYHALPGEVKYQVLDEAGRVLLSSDAGSVAFSPHGHFAPEAQVYEMAVATGVLQVVDKSFTHGGRRFYVQAASSQPMERLRRIGVGLPFIPPTLATVVFSLALSAAIGAWLLRSTLRPLREASEAAASIEPRNLEARLKSDALPSELQPLIEGFNTALERLEKGFRLQQEFLATAAHELKTPLALIRGQIELGLPAGSAALLRDVDLMTRQVQQLLSLAEVSESRNFRIDSVDANAAAAEATHYLQRLAAPTFVLLEVRTLQPVCRVMADRGALFVLLKNLIENAIRHSPRRGVVQITVSAQSITVCDEGGGIDPEHLPRVFTRFWRGPERRTEGAGLGLAICEEIARAHGWILSVANTNAGAAFTVAFGNSTPV